MSTPRTRPEAAKSTRAREKRTAGERIASGLSSAVRYAKGKPDPGTITHGGHQPTKAPRGGPIETRPTPPRGGSSGAKPPGMVTVTRTNGSLSETFTGSVADLRRLGVVSSSKGKP